MTTYADVLREDITSRITARLETSASAVPDAGWLSPRTLVAPEEPSGPLARLEPLEAIVVVAAGLIEVDIRFGALFASLQAPLPARRPCIGLLSWLLSDADHEPAEVSRTCHDLVRRGLLTVDNTADPRSEWVVRVPVPVWDAVCEVENPPLPEHIRLRSDFPPLGSVAVGADLIPVLSHAPELLAEDGLSAIVIRGARGSGRTTIIGSAAATLGLRVLEYDGDPGDPAWLVFAALASLLDVVPVLRCEPAPGETLTIPALSGVQRPLGVVVGRHGGIAGRPLERAVSITLTTCGAAERRLLWRTGGLTDANSELDEIAERFMLTPGMIVRTAPLAIIEASTSRRDRITVPDVAAATRSLRKQELETLATGLDPLPPGDYPILPTPVLDEMQTLVCRCLHRERLAFETAAGHLPNPGVRALFSGPSGTGKTLAARHLGSLLQLDVYRVDLAAVVNKYIGETERNLDRVFSRAEELDVVLLLDEGDALLTRRTEVANANDRYANLETNFLLQRLETFSGIVVITSNAAGRIDPAFLRRIDVTVDFTAPDAEQRRQIWAAHLPADHAVEGDVLREVAQRCSLTGGQIRNAALHAMLLAVDGGRAVGSEELLAGVRREYRRSGATDPLANRSTPASVPTW